MKKILLAIALAAAPVFSAQAAETKGVMATIAPLHSLVQGVMGDTGEAELIVTGYASPHNYQLKPSQVRAMQKANFIFYIGGGLETFLTRSFETLPSHVRKVSMVSKSELEILENREGGAWEAHDHTAHAHDNHDEKEEGHKDKHGHDDHKDHKDHADHKEGHHDHGGHEGHDEHDDHHLWLSPANAQAMLKTIARELSRVYPENKTVYKQNAKAMIARIAAADEKIRGDLAAVKDVPYVVFHDAYQYFEKHYNLTAVGSILLEPEEAPGVARIREIRAKIDETKAACVFREPQFSDKIVNTVIESTSARSGTIDPIGADIKPGAGQYVSLLEKIAKGLKDCLGQVG